MKNFRPNRSINTHVHITDLGNYLPIANIDLFLALPTSTSPYFQANCGYGLILSLKYILQYVLTARQNTFCFSKRSFH